MSKPSWAEDHDWLITNSEVGQDPPEGAVLFAYLGPTEITEEIGVFGNHEIGEVLRLCMYARKDTAADIIYICFQPRIVPADSTDCSRLWYRSIWIPYFEAKNPDALKAKLGEPAIWPFPLSRFQPHPWFRMDVQRTDDGILRLLFRDDKDLEKLLERVGE